MTRDEIIQQGRHHALAWIAKGELVKAVAEFVGQMRLYGLDPPLHHALITKGILIAEKGDEPGVRKWLKDMS